MPNISIHALLAESDDNGYDGLSQVTVFLSTLSLRRATGILTWGNCFALISIHALLAESDPSYWSSRDYIRISIHALLAESDLCPRKGRKRHNNFYPRSPCGERLQHWILVPSALQFLSTLSLRRATGLFMLYDTTALIFLSTLSLRRATAPNRHPYHCNRNFYPRSPCGERRQKARPKLPKLIGFLSTLSLRRAT